MLLKTRERGVIPTTIPEVGLTPTGVAKEGGFLYPLSNSFEKKGHYRMKSRLTRIVASAALIGCLGAGSIVSNMRPAQATSSLRPAHAARTIHIAWFDFFAAHLLQ